VTTHQLEPPDKGVRGTAPRPKRELTDVLEDEARLEALRRTSLLDSPPEEAFDRLTRLATAVLHVPVAIISLLDRDRQFIKSACGLSGSLESLRKTPLEHSFSWRTTGSIPWSGTITRSRSSA
jgi:hypothetical protein